MEVRLNYMDTVIHHNKELAMGKRQEDIIEIKKSLLRLEDKIDNKLIQLEERTRSLESFRAYAKGFTALGALVIGFIGAAVKKFIGL